MPCLWIKFAYFTEKKKTINLKPNSNEPVLIWNKIDSRIRQATDRPDVLPNWSVIFPSQTTEDMIPDMEFEPPSMPTLPVCNIIRIYSKVEDYEIDNKTRVDTEYEWEKMAAASTSTSSHY